MNSLQCYHLIQLKWHHHLDGILRYSHPIDDLQMIEQPNRIAYPRFWQFYRNPRTREYRI